MILIASQFCSHAYAFDNKHSMEMRRHSCIQRRALPLESRNYTDWDAGHIYHQLVILVGFADCDFKQSNPQSYYNQVFNQNGYNEGSGPGSVADYFRAQSSGRLNMQFDIYGPVRLNCSARSDEEISMREGKDVFREAAWKVVEEHPEIDWSVYDWYGDGRVSQVLFVFAGYAGNQMADSGFIWPFTDEFAPITTPDGRSISIYSSSGELSGDGSPCGIGTICHEFSHCLGLPDIYPTLATVEARSIVDEWDLMDGGNYTGKGWCPPNYSPLEKMLLGWLTPVELKEDTVITNLKPVADGGEAFIVFHTEDEFYLLENRQQNGWDFGLPGSGLLVYHVDYNKYAWGANSVNNEEGRPMYSIVSADNLDFTDWYKLLMDRGIRNPYVKPDQRLNSHIMSTAPYPWHTDSTSIVNHSLTAYSIPATIMYNRDASGSYFLRKAITDITQNADGTVSFTFRKSDDTGISIYRTGSSEYSDILQKAEVYTLQGVKVRNLRKGNIYIRNGNKFVY